MLLPFMVAKVIIPYIIIHFILVHFRVDHITLYCYLHYVTL